MQTQLTPEYANTAAGKAAEAILRKCVHCGFCTATCPTYQLLGDELDGPRGRIYLIKQVLEGATPTRETQLHLDRCLTCRNCETTCPSGVRYGELIDIGRAVVEAKVERPAKERAVRWLLKEGLTSPAFSPAMKLGQTVRGMLPEVLQNKLPDAAKLAPARPWPTRQHARKVLMLAGCVQPAMAPNINAATARVLDAVGVQTVVVKQARCCGAIAHHLNDHDASKAQMKANIDAWWPHIAGAGKDEAAAEAIVINASGCGVMVKDYGHLLADDPAYADKAKRVAELAKDLSEVLDEHVPALLAKLGPNGVKSLGRVHGGSVKGAVVAYHPPCTLQHGQKLRGGVEALLTALGFSVQVAQNEAHLCCGSAGTTSVLHPELAYPLRDRKLGHLKALKPTVIASSNIGCISHLQSGTDLPVRHWVELVDGALSPAPI